MTNFDIKIIGIYGASGSGKDTLARLIQNNTLPIRKVPRVRLTWDEIAQGSRLDILDYSRFEVKKFATAPKQIIADILNVPLEMMEDRVFKRTPIEKYGKSPIQMVIDMSQGMKRDIGDSIWVDCLMGKHTDQFWVISDLRFPGEYDAIKAKGGLCVRLKANNTDAPLSMDGLLDDREFDWEFTNDFSDRVVMINGVKDFLYQYRLFYEFMEAKAWAKQHSKR